MNDVSLLSGNVVGLNLCSYDEGYTVNLNISFCTICHALLIPPLRLYFKTRNTL